MVDQTLQRFAGMTPGDAARWLLLLNIGLFGLSIAAGQLLVKLFHDRPVSNAPDPVSWQEWALAGSCVLLNTVVAIAGWFLWRRGWIVVRPSTPLRTLADAVNLAFGTLGHLGVEPFPRSISHWPVLRHLGSSTFHANHHGDRGVNFGFYTDMWDRLFNTRGQKPVRQE